MRRREFLEQTAAAGALWALSPAARVLGANDRVVTASIGVRGQGNSLKRGFARLKNVEIKTLCDIDANLAPSRINDDKLADVSTFKPGFVQDFRRALDDKDIDAVVIATPNHWHALATIWALQAGKHAYVETSTSYEPAYDAQYLSKVNYDLWLGPAPKAPFNRNHFHYNWHWHWNYGNGDSGNQGPHQFDIARWGLQKNEHPLKIRSTGGYFGDESSQETPNLQDSTFEYADGTILEFGTRGGFTNDEGSVKIGNLFYGTKGWLWIEENGK